MARLTTTDEDELNYLCGQREDRRGRRREREAEGHRVVCYASGCPIQRDNGMGGGESRRGGFEERLGRRFSAPHRIQESPCSTVSGEKKVKRR